MKKEVSRMSSKIMIDISIIFLKEILKEKKRSYEAFIYAL